MADNLQHLFFSPQRFFRALNKLSQAHDSFSPVYGKETYSYRCLLTYCLTLIIHKKTKNPSCLIGKGQKILSFTGSGRYLCNLKADNYLFFSR
jgi:hypothetical protein